MKAPRARRGGWRRLLLVGCVALLVAGCTVGLGGTTDNTTNENNGSCDAAGGGNSVDCATAQAANAGEVATTGASQAPVVPGGEKLGEYTVTLPAGDYVPVGPSAPTRSQESTSPSGDLVYNTFSGVAYFAPNTPFSTIAPFSGVPTYAGCSQDLNTQGQVGAGQGSAFCLFETQPARTVGGIVTYIDQSAINPDSVTVQLTVWSGNS
jgi:hypothetical protein